MQVVDYIFVSIAFYQNFVEVCLNLFVKVLSRVSRDEKATLFCFSFVAFHVHSNLAVDLFFTVPAYSNKRFETFTFRYVLFFFFLNRFHHEGVGHTTERGSKLSVCP